MPLKYSPRVQNFLPLGAYRGHRAPERKFRTPWYLGKYYSYNVEIKNTIRYCEVFDLGTKNYSARGIQGAQRPL